MKRSVFSWREIAPDDIYVSGTDIRVTRMISQREPFHLFTSTCYCDIERRLPVSPRASASCNESPELLAWASESDERVGRAATIWQSWPRFTNSSSNLPFDGERGTRKRRISRFARRDRKINWRQNPVRPARCRNSVRQNATDSARQVFSWQRKAALGNWPAISIMTASRYRMHRRKLFSFFHF